MNNHTPYSSEWFKKQRLGAATSAEVVVPLVINLVAPTSVADIGCGVGVWLAAFAKHGIGSINGYDGIWIEKKDLQIPESSFHVVDFEKDFSISQKADLSVSLEVGEHLTHGASISLVKKLTAMAPVVLFSAAIPHQPGTNHINCQWPQYWTDLFKEREFVPVDCIRRKIWTNPNVEYWYAQNIFIFIKESELWRYPKLQQEIDAGNGEALPLVHPRRYLSALKPSLSFRFRLMRKIRSIVNK